MKVRRFVGTNSRKEYHFPLFKPVLFVKSRLLLFFSPPIMYIIIVVIPSILLLVYKLDDATKCFYLIRRKLHTYFSKLIIAYILFIQVFNYMQFYNLKEITYIFLPDIEGITGVFGAADYDYFFKKISYLKNNFCLADRTYKRL